MELVGGLVFFSRFRVALRFALLTLRPLTPKTSINSIVIYADFST